MDLYRLSILGSARCGYVLNVVKAYLTSSHTLILFLLAGRHVDGISADHGGHEHTTSHEVLDAMHPSLEYRCILIVPDTCDAWRVSASLFWLSRFVVDDDKPIGYQGLALTRMRGTLLEQS